MTTILASKEGWIVADGRTCCGGRIMHEKSSKIFHAGSMAYALSGATGLVEQKMFQALIGDPLKDLSKCIEQGGEENIIGVALSNSSLFTIYGDGSYEESENGVTAVGSGAEYALGYFHGRVSGACPTQHVVHLDVAIDAIRFAALNDVFTGPNVQSDCDGKHTWHLWEDF